MAYVKISDPNIIDLAAWHQVVNVVNQHSDSINNLTNNFGTSSVIDWTASPLTHQYDPGSQAIVFGKASGYTPNNSGSPSVYYGNVAFADVQTGTNSFSAAPVVTATIWTGNASTVSTTLDDLIINVYNVTSTGFSYRLYRTGSTKTVSGTVYVNWIAIGPR